MFIVELLNTLPPLHIFVTSLYSKCLINTFELSLIKMCLCIYSVYIYILYSICSTSQKF